MDPRGLLWGRGGRGDRKKTVEAQESRRWCLNLYFQSKFIWAKSLFSCQVGVDSCNFLGSTVEPGAWETAPKGPRTKQSRTLGTTQNIWRAGVGKISSVSGQKVVVAPRAQPAHGRPFINFLNSTSKFAKSPSWRSSRLPKSTCLPRTRHVWDVVKVVKLDLLFPILKENDPELTRVATVCVLSPPPVRGSKVHARRLHLSRGHASAIDFSEATIAAYLL